MSKKNGNSKRAGKLEGSRNRSKIVEIDANKSIIMVNVK